MTYILDFIVIGILGFCVYCGYRKGFLVSVFKLFSLLITLFLTNMLYPFAGAILRDIGLLDLLKGHVAKGIPLDTAAANLTHMAENTWIDNLALPEFIKSAMIANNNTQARAAMAVANFKDYVSTYLAGLILNAIAILLVFVAVFFLMKLIVIALKILSKLPVIHTLNNFMGVILGLLQGTLLVWLVLAVLIGLFATSTAFPVGLYLESSTIAKWFHENNIIWQFITQITA